MKYLVKICVCASKTCSSIRCVWLKDCSIKKLKTVRYVQQLMNKIKQPQLFWITDEIEIDSGTMVYSGIEFDNFEGFMMDTSSIYCQYNETIMKISKVKNEKKCPKCNVMYKLKHSQISCQQRVFYQQCQGLQVDVPKQTPLFVEFNKTLIRKGFSKYIIFYDIEAHSVTQECEMLCFTIVNEDLTINQELEMFVKHHYTYAITENEMFVILRKDIDDIPEYFVDILLHIIHQFEKIVLFTSAYNGCRYDETFFEKCKLKICTDHPHLLHTYRQVHGRILQSTVMNVLNESLVEVRDIFHFVPSLRGGKSLRKVCEELKLEMRKVDCAYKIMDLVFAKENMFNFIDAKTGFFKQEILTLTTDEDYEWASNKFGSNLMKYITYYCCMDVNCVLYLTKWLWQLMDNTIIKPLSVEVCYKRVLQQPSDLFNFLTLSQFAYKMFESFCHYKQIEITAPWYDYESNIRLAMYGGRVASSIYGQDIYTEVGVVDIVSQYPSAFCCPMPFGAISLATMEEKIITAEKCRYNFNLFDIPPFLGKFIVKRLNNIAEEVGECEFHQKLAFSSLPVKYKKDLLWPSEGEYVGWYSCVDVWNAQQDGWEFELICKEPLYYWLKWDSTVGEFFKYWYNLKKNAENENVKILAKILLNCVFGKCLQTSLYPTFDHDLETGYLKKLTEECYTDHNFKPTAWGIFTLSYSRVLFCKMRNKIVKYGGTIYYGDTDSAFASYDSLVSWKTNEPHYFTNNLGGFENNIFKFSVTLEGCDCHQGKFNHIIVLARKLYYLENTECNECKKGLRGHPKNTSLELFESAIYDSKQEIFTTYTERDSLKIILYNANIDAAFTRKSVTLKRKFNVVIPRYYKKCTCCTQYIGCNLSLTG